MSSDWQDLATLGLVLAAGLYLARGVLARFFPKAGGGGCGSEGGCGGCSKNTGKVSEEPVQIGLGSLGPGQRRTG